MRTSARQVRRVASRLSWGIADQGVSSLTNFLLNAFVARTLGAREFGAFALAYVTYGVALNISRALSIEPLLVRFSGMSMPVWRRATSGSTGTALLVGLATGICALTAGIVAGGTTGQAFLGLGLVLPVLMLQDSWRYAFFAVRQGRHAFTNDMLWAVVEIPLLIGLKETGHATVFWLVIAWGAGAAAGAALGAFQARTLPSMNRALPWLVAHSDLGPRFLAENVGSNASSTLQSYAVSSLLGLQSVGYMQSANVLMGPFRILSYGVGMMTVPEASRLMRREPRKAVRYCVALSGGQSVLVVLWTTTLLIALPLGLGHLLIGNLWPRTYPLVLPTALGVLSGCVGTGAATGLHAMGAAKRSMRLALVTGALYLSFSCAGAALGSVLLTLYLAAAASWIGTVVTWLQFRQALRELQAPQASGQVHPHRGRHQQSVSHRLPRFRPAKNIPDAAAPGGAVSHLTTQRSYVRERHEAIPYAAGPGEEG
jgi:O-antigen/teichoic acid export membrane protein